MSVYNEPGRLCARDRLTEVCAADLRFTPAETATFLNFIITLMSTIGIGEIEEKANRLHFRVTTD